MKWFPLCNYTHYSLLKGFSKPYELVAKCVKNGYTSCGIADYKSISGSVTFYNVCVEAGIKPIIGCSFDDFKLFAKNKDGWNELIQIASSVEPDGSYNEDLLARLSTNGNLITVARSKEVSPIKGDDCFIHCRDTQPSYYADQKDAILHRVLLCTKAKTTFPKMQKPDAHPEIRPFFNTDKMYLKDAHEVDQESEVLSRINDKCEEYNILHKPILPDFDPPDGLSQDDYLWKLCLEGWEELLVPDGKVDDEDKIQEYRARLEKEFKVIQDAELCGYFLIVQDILMYVKRMGWRAGHGRGSAAGSLISYLMGITHIDPIEFDLIFERFYNSGRNTADRVSLPDIDIDIPGGKRDEIIAYIKNKYGHKKVGQMLTFGRLRGRSAIKEVMRVNEACGFAEVNEITKYIPDEADIQDQLQQLDEEDRSIILWALTNNSKELMDFCHLDDEGGLAGPYAEYFEQAIRMEGTFKSQGKHPAGVVISAFDLDTVCPMVNQTKGGEKIAGLEMDDLELLGHTKFDVLAIVLLDKLMMISSRSKLVQS